MTTRQHFTIGLAVAASIVVAVVGTGSSRPDAVARSESRFSPTETQTLSHQPSRPRAYGWPVKPFDVQHPVRAFLDDPRIGHEGGKAFHFGIDVAAPDGTPVYAVSGGILYLSHGSLAVVAGPHHEFGYWHIRRDPALVEHQVVHRHQLLGWIAPGWGHVHFAERVGDEYINPLRPGGLGPYTDPRAPTIDSLRVVADAGSFELTARAHDTTWPPVPGPWAHEPVTPALLRWRIGTTGRWQVAADFRTRMLDRNSFRAVYAPETTQNHEGRPGTFVFILTKRWRPADGTYRIQVAASDTRGNTAVGSIEVRVVDQQLTGSRLSPSN